MGNAPICEICGNAMPVYRSMSICEQCLADAKLGRMVRKLTEQPVDAGLCLIYAPFRGQWSPTIDANRFGWFDNPIDALLAAGIADE